MHLKYRPEIDGLRTIAVLSVLIYHAEFAFGSGKLLSGGFLGVDIFFVISGFLITSLIIKEQIQTGQFSLGNFYERRARRILPALFAVMLVSLPFAWLHLIPLQHIDFSKSQISSLLFSSNFYWDHSLQKYDAESALIKPFLHTWSLAVEEQFYIIFPLILIALHRWSRNHAISLISTALICSLLLSEWMTGQNPSNSFYMLPSRFWELLSGSLLAYILFKHPQKDDINSLTKNLPLLGIALIIYSIIFTEYNDNHPGFITLTVIIGTMLIIWFANKNDPVTRLLSSKLFVGTGLISYSLYLWHYPIFAFARIINPEPSAYEKFSWFALTLILSLLSYFLIEKPFRNKTRFSRRTLSISLSLTAILIFGLNAASIHYEGHPSRLPSIISNIEMQPSKARVCNSDAPCTFNQNSEKTLFLVGDSHIMPLEKPLLKDSKQKKYNLTTLNTNGCQYILNLNKVRRSTGKSRNCTIELQQSRRATLLSKKHAVIVIGGNLPAVLPSKNNNGKYPKSSRSILQYADNSIINEDQRKNAIIKEYKNSIIELANYGQKIILIYPIPGAGLDVPSKMAQMIFKKSEQEVKTILADNMITTSYSSFLKKTKDSFALLDSIQHKNITRIYPHKLFCDTVLADKCVTHNLTQSYYRDYHHLSETGANMLFELMDSEIEKAFKAQGQKQH